MSVYKFQVTFPTDSAIPADYVTNTWHFENHVVGGIPSDYDNVRDMLKDFYATTPAGGTSSVSSYMAGTLNSPAVVKAYKLDDTPPRAPVYESTFAATFASTGGMPAEVAMCLSFQAARASGSPQNRRRNRVYLGPLTGSVCDTLGRPTSAFITAIQKSAQALKAASIAATSWDWVVYSPFNNAFYDVHDGWIDNAFDTQRRRGLDPTTRSTFT